MNKIALPQNVEFIRKDGDKNTATVVIEPCYPGYGTTLGNALRRVLLSSLEGAAVIGVKIKGADHEFMALPHVKEDVLEILLNLKKLRVKMFTDEVVKLEISVHGEKAVTAGDIKDNSDVEIANKDLVIANITDMAGKFEGELFISRGRGYETIESRESGKHEIGYIEMDSIFSPVLAVSVNIENTRVGKMTNWDKLVMDITTDGTITVEEAFENSVNVLLEQFSSLLKASAPSAEVEAEAEEKEVKEAEVEVEASAIIEEDEDGDDAAKKRRGRPKKG